MIKEHDTTNKRPFNGFSVVSLVLGFLWIFGLGSIAAIVLGVLAVKQIKRSNDTQRGKGLAIAGIVSGSLGLIVIIFLIYAGSILHKATPTATRLDSPTNTVSSEQVSNRAYPGVYNACEFLKDAEIGQAIKYVAYENGDDSDQFPLSGAPFGGGPGTTKGEIDTHMCVYKTPHNGNPYNPLTIWVATNSDAKVLYDNPLYQEKPSSFDRSITDIGQRAYWSLANEKGGHLLRVLDGNVCVVVLLLDVPGTDKERLTAAEALAKIVLARISQY